MALLYNLPLSNTVQVNLIVAEMRDPIRDLPRAIHTAIPTITICFVLVNLAYYIILPWEVVQASDAIAVVLPAHDSAGSAAASSS